MATAAAGTEGDAVGTTWVLSDSKLCEWTRESDEEGFAKTGGVLHVTCSAPPVFTRASDVVCISTQWRLESVVHGPGRPVSTREGGARLRFEPDRSNERCTHTESESESYRAASARKRVLSLST